MFQELAMLSGGLPADNVEPATCGARLWLGTFTSFQRFCAQQRHCLYSLYSFRGESFFCPL